MYADRLHFMNK